jgi:hypothetical protein
LSPDSIMHNRQPRTNEKARLPPNFRNSKLLRYPRFALLLSFILDMAAQVQFTFTRRCVVQEHLPSNFVIRASGPFVLINRLRIRLENIWTGVAHDLGDKDRRDTCLCDATGECVPEVVNPRMLEVQRPSMLSARPGEHLSDDFLDAVDWQICSDNSGHKGT